MIYDLDLFLNISGSITASPDGLGETSVFEVSPFPD